MLLVRNHWLRITKFLLGTIIILILFHWVYGAWIKDWLLGQGINAGLLNQLDAWLVARGIERITNNWLLIAFIGILILLFFPGIRNLVFLLLRQFNRLFKALPSKQTIELAKRYVNIVRYARYLRQADIFDKLIDQYPAGSSMIVLPMDMEFMGAGKPSKPFEKQMEELAMLKTRRPGKIHPFLFVDPRRKVAGNKNFFEYTVIDNKVILSDCFIKDYMETKQFSGFKIYPAIGYFPFDEMLLPLWKYAADNGIPIMTHCIRGVVYYRGSKNKAWDFHPVFEQAMGDLDGDKVADYQPMILPQMKPVDVQEIFTHPLNYACLLKEELLAKLVGRATDHRIKQLFGYNPATGSISHGLSHLKICFGHFGGEDEWAKFFEKDRDNYADQLVKFPDKGIDFLSDGKNIKRGKPEQIWKHVDWYSIICSLMLQHENVYADISYILHGDHAILPLLRHTLQLEKLKTRVLYGSDFYVVRNHKSDKNMLADIKGGLLEKDFDQIARINPVQFLKRNN